MSEKWLAWAKKCVDSTWVTVFLVKVILPVDTVATVALGAGTYVAIPWALA
jgi:hypothetical protein